MPSSRLSEAEVVDYVVSFIANPATAANQTVISAPGVGWKWVCYGYQLAATGGANNVTLTTGAGPTAKTPVLGFAANGGIVCPPVTIPYWEGGDNEVVGVTLSAATAVGVALQMAKARV